MSFADETKLVLDGVPGWPIAFLEYTLPGEQEKNDVS